VSGQSIIILNGVAKTELTIVNELDRTPPYQGVQPRARDLKSGICSKRPVNAWNYDHDPIEKIVFIENNSIVKNIIDISEAGI
jgi:hypothetical protein